MNKPLPPQQPAELEKPTMDGTAGKSLVFPTPMGIMGLRSEDGVLTRLFLPDTLPQGMASDPEPGPLLREAAAQVCAFLVGERENFSLPLRAAGSDFQRAVWERMAAIPYGETMTYGDLARAVGRPGGAQAVGRACGDNPIAIILPCHRVMGRDGKLTGFGGGLAMKRRLLWLEADRRFARAPRPGQRPGTLF